MRMMFGRGPVKRKFRRRPTTWIDEMVGNPMNPIQDAMFASSMAVIDFWTKDAREVLQAANEGWMLDCTTKLGWHIAPSSEVADGTMDTIGQCEVYVHRRAVEGSDMHKRALAAIAYAHIQSS